MKYTTVLLHVSLIPGIGPAVVAKINTVLAYERFADLYWWSVQDFTYKAGLSEKIAQVLVEGLFDTKILEQELALLEKHSINWVTIAQEEYPALLRATHLPPIVLYWQGGNLSILDESIAMVGSRKASRYAQKFIDATVPVLVQADVCLVSGGALGADTMVHAATLASGGMTCAVIGSGLLVPYPASNRKLFETIIKTGGIVMSPFPLTMQAVPGNFPSRNRIISGLSRVTVVVQAAAKSGALITAMYALEQGRDVCAVPGPVDDPLSAGCHAIIHEGAALVTSAHDILAVCADYYTFAPLAKTIPSESKKEDLCPLQPEHHEISPGDPVVAACAIPQMFDDLCILLGYDETQLQERLLMLQLEGILDQDIMGRWYSIK